MLTRLEYWDSITKEDLEFSVGTKQNNWEVKETLLDGNDDSRNSAYLASRGSIYDLSGPGARSSLYEPSLDYPTSIGNKEYPQSIGSYQQQPQMDQRQMQAPVPKPSRRSYQERQISPERSHERERPATSGQSRDREQLRLSYQQPESDSTTQNVVRPRRTDDYYERKRSSVRAD